MLEAEERDASRSYDELSGVGGAHAHHEHDVVLGVEPEQLTALRFGVTNERHHVRPLQNGTQIASVRQHGRSDDVHEVRTVGVDDVIVPVGLQQPAVTLEVAAVGGEDRKSTRLNSSHSQISYAVFC